MLFTDIIIIEQLYDVVSMLLGNVYVQSECNIMAMFCNLECTVT